MNSCSCKEDFITPIIKVVDFCNFSCDFCRYAKNPTKMIMSIDTYTAIVEKACEYNTNRGFNHLTVIFHGGEPLLWGMDNFHKALEIQNRLIEKYPKLSINNNIQTNASLLSDKWIDFFKNNKFNIGVSIDGPDEINFHRNSLGNQTVLDNIRKLSESDCRFGILSVITDAHRGQAENYYNFIKKNNIHSVGFCYCIYDLEKHITVKNENLTEFLTRFFELYFNGDYRLRVREFEYVMRLCMGAKTNACTYSFRSKCGNYFSVYPNGDIYFCDPYSLDSTSIGNINVDTFIDVKNNPLLQNIILKAQNSVATECQNCSVNEICGGGCFRHTFENGKNAFCETFRAVYPYIREKIQKNMGTKDIRKNNT